MAPVTAPPSGRPLTAAERLVRGVCETTHDALFHLERLVSKLGDSQTFLLPGQAAEGLARGLGRVERGEPDLHPSAIDATHGRWSCHVWDHGAHPVSATAAELVARLDEAEEPLLALLALAQEAKRLLDLRDDLRSIADDDAHDLVGVTCDLFERTLDVSKRAQGAQG